MTVVLTKGYTSKQYADKAVQANASGQILTILKNGDVDMSLIVVTFEEVKAKKLKEISNWTKRKITGGFVSTATGDSVTFDSDEETQSTMQTMHTATLSPDFATHPAYQGHVPVRGYVEGSTVKTVFHLNAEQVQKFMTDLALHIGTCKQQGWEKQALVASAETVAQVNAIILE